jgi:hypothetical protein
MTVEASLVVPVVICVFAVIIYFSNYLYDRCVLAQDCYVLAFRATSSANNRMYDDPGEYVMEKSAKVAGKKYFGCSRPYFKAIVKGSTVEVGGHVSVKHAMTGSFASLSRSSWEIDVTQRAKKRDYAGHIRTIKRLRDIGTKEIE